MPIDAVAAPFLAELEAESTATRRVLERLPADKLAWRPHPKSHTLGQLAWHVANMPSAITRLLEPDLVVAEDVDFSVPQPKSRADVLKAFEDGLAVARAKLAAWSSADFARVWRMTRGGVYRSAAPRGAMVRTLACNHLYHHRGQLTVYLRLLDVPLPPVYGPSADEAPTG